MVNSIYSNRDDSIIQVTEWQVFRLFIVQLVQVLILILFPNMLSHVEGSVNKFPFFFLFFEREEKNKRDTFFIFFTYFLYLGQLTCLLQGFSHNPDEDCAHFTFEQSMYHLTLYQSSDLFHSILSVTIVIRDQKNRGGLCEL